MMGFALNDYKILEIVKMTRSITLKILIRNLCAGLIKSGIYPGDTEVSLTG